MWLASLPADMLSHSEFRVLFHLCDCHNASGGCFPAQGYLMRETSLSNGGLNKALNALEARGIIARHRSFDGVTKRRRPTQYTLGFELPAPGDAAAAVVDPTTDARAVEKAQPTPLSGEGANSTLSAKPSPLLRKSHLHASGVEPVIEPVINPAHGNRGASARPTRASSIDDVARFWAKEIADGKTIPQTAISPTMARRIIEMRLATQEQLQRHGVVA